MAKLNSTEISGGLTATGSIKSTGSNMVVQKRANWAQFQAYSASNIYHAFEANDELIRLDCRNFTGAGTDNRRFLDIRSSKYQNDAQYGLILHTIYTSVLKSGSTIKSGSTLNGTAYSTDTPLDADLTITTSSTLKTGSTIKADSIVNGNKYTADTVTTADITLTRNTGTTNNVITDAGGTMKGALNMSKNDITNVGRIYNYGNLATAGRDSSDTGTYFFEVARCTVTEAYRGAYALINVHDSDGINSCLLELNTYRSTASTTPVICIGVKSTIYDSISSYWLDKFYCVANYNSNSTTTVYQLFLKTTSSYQGCRFVFLDETANFRKRDTHSFWTKYNNISTSSGYANSIPKLSGYDLQETAVDNSFGQVRANTIITNGNKVVTIPNETATLASTNTAQTISAVKTFSSAPKISATLATTLNDDTVSTTKWVKNLVKLYNHIIKLDFSGIRVFLTIVNNSSAEFTANTLHKYFVDNSITGSDVDGNFYPCTGFLKSYADIILGINSHDDGNNSTSVFGLVHHYGTQTTGIVTRSSPTVIDNVVPITF